MKFKPGDKVKWTDRVIYPLGTPATVSRVGADCVYVRWHPRGPESGGWNHYRFELDKPLTPFEEQVRAYIRANREP